MSVIQPLARNISLWRQRRDLSVSDLARAAGIAKSTLSELERGRGNPSLDTVSALALALNVPFSSMFAETVEADFEVVRGDRLTEVSKTATWSATLLAQIPASGDIEIYRLTLAAGASRQVRTHNFGAAEMLYVIAGQVLIETKTETATMQAGDLAVFSANIERTYHAPTEDAEFLLINRYVDTERIVNMRIQRQARGVY